MELRLLIFEELTISDSDDLIEEVIIVNAQGMPQDYYNKNEINIKDLFPGYYLVRMVLKNVDIVIRRFIKL